MKWVLLCALLLLPVAAAAQQITVSPQPANGLIFNNGTLLNGTAPTAGSPCVGLSGGKLTGVGCSGGGGANVLVPTVLPFASSPYSVSGTAQFLAASASASADFVANLPAATGTGDFIVVKKMDANAHNIAVTPHGTDTIDGLNAAYDIPLPQYSAFEFVDYATGKWAVF